MLRGVGVDVVDLARFRVILERRGEKFITRWFEPEELSQPGEQARNLARSFAAKEAVLKAIRPSGVRRPAWREIVATGEGASMQVRLSGLIGQQAAARDVVAIHVSATVHGQLMIATALAELGHTSGTSPIRTGLSCR